MKRTEEIPFIGMLATAPERPLTQTEGKLLEGAFNQYIDLLHTLASQSRRSPLERLHELALLQARLMRLQERITRKDSLQSSMTESALLLTKFEIQLVFTRLRYPSIADEPAAEVPKSPLYLAKGFTPTDLMELIAALQISGAVCRIDGSQPDLQTLVDVLAHAFNVRINNPEQCRHAVVNRKLRLTRFLDSLRNHMVEYSRR